MTTPKNYAWPTGFREQMQSILPADHAAFFQALSDPPPVSIRINPLKPITIPEKARPVPWCDGGWYLSERPRFILDPLWHAGCYYVQEASSMIIDLVIKELRLSETRQTALDLCAAPGGKATIINSALHPESFILANEVNKKRLTTLRNNIMKWGYSNVFLSHEDPRVFSTLPGMFDLILVDAPCSGEGLFRKDPISMEHWSEANIRLCSRRQTRILKDVLPALKPGGFLIYSTCTFNNEENIDVAQELVRSGLRSIEIPVVESYGFVRIKNQDTVGYQAFPHRLEGEGLFLAVLRRGDSTESVSSETRWKSRHVEIPDSVDEFLSSEIKPHLQLTQKKELFCINPGHHLIWQRLNDKIKVKPNILGQLKRDFVPNHALAMRSHLYTGATIELDFDQSLQYLSKQHLEELKDLQGWHLVTYNGYGLGWIKGIGYRYNNYLPNHLRILRDIDALKQ